MKVTYMYVCIILIAYVKLYLYRQKMEVIIFLLKRETQNNVDVYVV